MSHKQNEINYSEIRKRKLDSLIKEIKTVRRGQDTGRNDINIENS